MTTPRPGAKRLFVLSLLLSCVYGADDPECRDASSPEPPAMEVYEEAAAAAASKTWEEGEALVIDLEACESARWRVNLSMGSAWVVARPDGDHCELWLGGETESPDYDGLPTRYCRFLREGCEAEVGLTLEDGGPATVDSPACTSI